MAKYKMTKSRKSVGRVKSRKRRGRRRVGASGGLMQLAELAAGITLGAVAGRESATLIGNAIPTLQANPMMVGLVQVAGGVLLVKEAKGTFMQALGYGLIANGGVTSVVSTGIISGPPAYRLNGIGSTTAGNIKFVAGPQTRIGNMNGRSDLAFTSGLNGVGRVPVKHVF